MESKFNYKNFSIVIPIYNEEEIIQESTDAIYALCSRTGLNFEIIFSIINFYVVDFIFALRFVN